MKSLTLNIPDNVDVDSNDLLMIIASNLYEKGKLSLGQAAELSGLSKKTFAELLSKLNVSIFNSKLSEIELDLKNA